MIAAIAVGSHAAYIYIRGEYRYLLEIMQKAIADAYARGICGKNIFGSGYDLDVYWHGGAGAYEVGEESALWNRSKASAEFPASVLRSLPSSASGAVPRSSITPKPSPAFPTLFSWAARPMPKSA